MQAMQNWIEEVAADVGEELISFPDLANCVVGIIESEGVHHVVYDRQKIIQHFMDTEGWDADEAWEWFDFNVAGSRFSSGGPVFLTHTPPIMADDSGDEGVDGSVSGG
jgi:hypothetical protein